MIFYSLRVDEDVVKVNGIELVEVFSEDVVNLSLKRSGCVTQSEEYNKVFVESEAGSECGYLFFTLYHPKLVKRCDNVELYKDLSSRYAVKSFFNKR